MWRKNENVELLKYNRVNYTYSDHRPVYGIFKISTKKIIKEERDKIVKELKDLFNIGLSNKSDENNEVLRIYYNKL